MKNGFIKDDSGYTLIEALTGLSLLILLVTVCIIFFNSMFSMPSVALKGRAFAEARNQMELCLVSFPKTDTNYTTGDGQLLISRKITMEDSLMHITVSACIVASQKELVNLKVLQRNEQ